MSHSMGYQHIENLYKNQVIRLFRECYALEKIHGTSAHISWRDGHLHLSPGGESAVKFASLFDEKKLSQIFQELGYANVTVYGEAYGGRQQKQSWRYGPDLKFVVFDIFIEPTGWLTVPKAQEIAEKLGLEFVHYKLVSTDLEVLDAERDAPSEQARRNGVAGDQPREGVVLKPVVEFRDEFGERVICKHKRDEERETATPRKVADASQLEVLSKADDIAMEWVTDTRLDHVLQKLPQNLDLKDIPKVIAAMTEDVLREGKGEIVDSKEARAAISKRTVMLFKARVTKIV